MRSPRLLPILASLVLGALLAYWAYSQETVGVGYTVIRAEEGTPLPIASAIFQFRNEEGDLVSEAGIEAVEPIGWGRIFVDQGDTRTGVALANASLDPLTLDLVLRDADGLFVAQTTVPLGAQEQLPRFIDEFFRDLPPDYRLGSLTIRTQPPQRRVAAVTLRGSPNEHGESIFATLPVVDLDQQVGAEPPLGDSSLVFPHIGAGVVSALRTLSTQIILINPSETATLKGRIRLTSSQGTPLQLELEGTTDSDFPYELGPNQVFKGTLRSSGSALAGYAQVTVEEGNLLPSGTAIFQFRDGSGNVISEAGVGARAATDKARLFVDTVDTRTGVALASAGNDATTVRLELRDRSGFLLASSLREVPAEGHLALFVDEVFDTPAGFTGVLEIHSLVPVVPITLKLSQNRRGDSILTTLPIADLRRPPQSLERVVPQLAFGPGLSTRLILLSSWLEGTLELEQEQLTGQLLFAHSSGTLMQLALSGEVGGQFSYQVSRAGGRQLRPGNSATVETIELLECHFPFGCGPLIGNELSVYQGQQMLILAQVKDSAGEWRDDFNLTYKLSPDIGSVDVWGQVDGTESGFADLEVSHRDLKIEAVLKVVSVTSGSASENQGLSGVAQDGAGRLYLVGEGRHTILRSNSLVESPRIYAGSDNKPGFQNGPRLDSEFDQPAFLSYDHSQGRLYVSDAGNHRIRLVEPGAGGGVQTFAGRGQPGHRNGPGVLAEFNQPQGVARVRDFLWVVDSGNHVIRKVHLLSRVVQTVAGQAGSPGLQDGQGLEAQFNTPTGITVETRSASGPGGTGEGLSTISVIVADTGNGVLRRIDEQGQVQTIEVAASTNLGRIPAVSLTGIAPGFQSPLGVAVDPFGNQYISDQQSEEVWTLLSNGTLVRAAVPGSFSAPAGLLVSESGAVVVTDNDVTVRRLRYGQPEIESIQGDVDLGGGGVTVRGKNFAPETGVTVAGVKADELTVLDTRTLRVEIPSGLPSGRVALTVANRGGLAQSHLLIKPPSLAELAQGEITTVTGGKPFLEDGTLAARAALRGPSAATLDPDGHLFFSDTEHQQIRRIDAVTGIVTTVAGAGGLATDLPNPVGDGGPAKAALLSAPRGLALDTFGNLYFADEANDRIRKVDAVTGLIETVAGGGNSVPTELDPAGLGDGGPATEGRLAAPSGIWLDGQDNLLIADTGNHLIRKVSQQGLLSTVAGNGVPGFSGDEGSALEASLNGPTAVFGDRGQLYIADSLNHLIRQVDSEGTIFTVVGPGVSELLNDGFSFTTGGVLQSPRGLWVDNDGRLLIADTDNHRIRRFDPRLGTISTVAGTGIAGFSEDGAALETHLNRPAGVAVDGAGNLWVTDTGNDRVRRVSSQQISTLAGGEATEVGDSDPAIAAALGFSTAIALDSDNNAYISDYAHHRIRRVDASSRLINTAVGAGEAGDSGDGQTADQALLSSPAGLALDALGNLFFTDTDHHKVRRVDGLSQIISTVIQGDELSVIDPSFPRGIVFGVAGELFLADTGNHRILSADLLQQDLFLIAGTGERGVGPDIGAGPSVVFDTPYAVEVDLEGNLYIADSFNHRVRKVDTANGIVSTVAGNGTPGFGGDGGPAPQAQLHFPTGLFIDENRNLLIADSFNHRIRVVQLEAGIISTIVGGDTLGFSGDGGKASEARLNFPSSVRLDSNGNLLIADRNNHRIRAIKGPLSSIAGDPSPTRFLTKTASPDPVNAGDRLTYSLTLNNTTDRSLTNLRLVDALPETVTFVSAASTSGSCGRPDDQQQITCNLGNLGRNRQTVVTIEVNVKHSAAGTILTNSAICSSFQGEPDDCQATVNTRVRPADSADLAVTKQAPNQVYFPDPIPYVIKVTNHGPAVAKAATLVDTLPSGDLLTVASVESDHGNCSLNGERIDCELGVLAEDAVATVLIEMEPTESARSQVVGNRVEVSSTSKDFVLSDNTHFVSTRILPPRQGLFLEKSVSTKKASPGDTLVYSLKVTNFGPEAETSVEITDPLPPGVSLVSAIPGKGSCQSSIEGTLNQVRCSVGTLAKGESAGATVEVTVDQTTPDTILTNSASCRSDALGVQPCRSQEVHTAVRPRGCADLSLSVDSPSELLYDAEDPEDIVYTLNVANQGPSRVTDVRLTAVLPVDPLTGISRFIR